MARIINEYLIERILSYCDEELVIHFQKNLPRLMRIILVSDLNLVLESVRQYVRYLDIPSYCDYKNHVTERDIQQLTRLITLNCRCNNSMTDAMLKYPKYLMKLNCSSCFGISGKTFHHLTNLVELNCSFCNINDDGCSQISRLENLTKLDCTDCKNISTLYFAGSYCFTNLTILNCEGCNFDDNSISHLQNLTKLNCGGCKNIIGCAFRKLSQLNVLVCFECINIHNNAFVDLEN